MSSPNLSSFPEEILERILAHCVIAPTSQAPRPSWHQPAAASSTTPSSIIRGRLAVLLVSKTFLRICTPLFYHTVHISSSNQLSRLLSDALRPSPSLASYIRRLVLSGIWADAGELLQLCNTRLRMLDLTLDVAQLSPAVQGPIRDLDAEEFCEGLKAVTSLTNIVIRKPGNIYLTQPRPRNVLFELAKAMQSWDELEYADIAFRLSDDSGSALAQYVAAATRPPQTQKGPITALTDSLSNRPKLHTLSTVLPSVWNESILRISANPSLERIILGDGMGGHAAPVSSSGATLEGTHGIQSTGLFFLQAKKHARLCELIRAGTCIIRTRAHTIGSPVSSPLRVLAPLQSTTPSQASHHLSRAQPPVCHAPSQYASHFPGTAHPIHMPSSSRSPSTHHYAVAPTPATWQSSDRGPSAKYLRRGEL